MLLFFDTNTKSRPRGLSDITKRFSKSCKVIIHHQLAELKKQLCKPLQNLAAVILVANNQEELDDLISLAPLFEGIRTLVVLPVDDEVTIQKALNLHPTYYVGKDENMNGIDAVLSKIIRLK